MQNMKFDFSSFTSKAAASSSSFLKADASKTDSSKTDSTKTDSSKTDSTKTDSSAQSSSKEPEKKDRINFNLGDGLRFNTSISNKQPTKSAFNLGFSSSGAANNYYDDFLNDMPALHNDTKKEVTKSEPPKISKAKENLFEVHYVPISGIHFDQIFIQKENVYETADNLSTGPSFNQSIHISQTLDSLQ